MGTEQDPGCPQPRPLPFAPILHRCPPSASPAPCWARLSDSTQRQLQKICESRLPPRGASASALHEMTDKIPCYWRKVI